MLHSPLNFSNSLLTELKLEAGDMAFLRTKDIFFLILLLSHLCFMEARLLHRRALAIAFEESEAGPTTTVVFGGGSGSEVMANSLYDSKRLSPGGPDPQHHSTGPYSYAVSFHTRP